MELEFNVLPVQHYHYYLGDYNVIFKYGRTRNQDKLHRPIFDQIFSIEDAYFGLNWCVLRLIWTYISERSLFVISESKKKTVAMEINILEMDLRRL